MNLGTAAARLGARGGVAAWADVPPEERSARMSALGRRSRPRRLPPADAPYAVALAQRYDGQHTPERCLSQPKLDGIRAVVYTGGAGEVIVQSREGLRLTVPPRLLADMAIALRNTGAPMDGELRAGAGLADTQRAVLGAASDAVAYHIFDCMTEQPCSERVARLRGHGSVVIVPTLPVSRERRAIERRHDIYVAQGYEGLILRDADAPYRAGRRYAVQKLKVFADAEFPVVAVEHGGSGKVVMVCRCAAGEFRVAAPAGEDGADAVGQPLCVRYRQGPGGIPRDASAVAIRRVH